MQRLRLLPVVAALAWLVSACGSDGSADDFSPSDGGDAADRVAGDGGNSSGARDGGTSSDAGDGGTSSDAGDGGEDPPAAIYAVGGTVTGLAGTGLVLQNNGGDDIPIVIDGTFTFLTKLKPGDAFAVTIKTQPTSPAQTCTVGGGTGTIASGNVSSVAVTCVSDTFTIGGSVTGLVGAELVLQNNGADDLVVNSNGTFAFATTSTDGAPYEVTVKTQPTNPSQTCVVAGGGGTVTASTVTGVSVTCTTNTFAVGGTVAGLAGAGLVLQNSGRDDLIVGDNGTFAFVTPVASGAPYAVTVKTQPANPSQTCTVTNGSGTVGDANVATVAVSCATNTYSIGGNVSGLTGEVVLRNNGGDDLPLSANGAFTFPAKVASGKPYAVTVATQPAGKSCVVSNGSGTVAAADVTNVAVTCSPAISFPGSSFENGFSGWTLTRLSGLPAHGGAVVVASGTTLTVGSTVQEVISNTFLTITHDSDTLPQTFTALAPADGAKLGMLVAANGPVQSRAAQVITVPVGTTSLKFNVQYGSGPPLNDATQVITVRLFDPVNDALLATLYKAGTGTPKLGPMTTVTANIAAYAGMQVRLELEIKSLDNDLYAAFDAFWLQ